MKGKEFNKLCKTIAVFSNTAKLTKEISVIDSSHVMLLTVKNLDGISPAFGIESDKGIDVKDIIKAKIPAKSDVEITIVGDVLNIETDVSFNSFAMIDDVIVPKPVVIEYNNNKLKADAKAFIEAVKVANDFKGNDFISFESEEGILYAKFNNSNGLVGKRKICDFPHYGDVSVKIPLSHILGVAKVMTGKEISIQIETDYPIRIVWCDGDLEYSALIAPRVDCQ